jgi:two-component system sensor histidine kinase CiaH
MFRDTRRRLALLNVGLVCAVVAVVVLLIYTVLQASLNREANHALDERISLAASIWDSQLTAGNPVQAPATAEPIAEPEDEDDEGKGEEEDEQEDALHDALETGDTLVLVMDREGTLIVDERGITSDIFPIEDAVVAALEGTTDTRTVRLEEETVRVRTRPVIVDDAIVGVVQAVRSDREHLAELAIVRNIGIAGLLAGLVAAFPAGLYLSGRAMGPIALAFERQRAFVANASHELKTPLAVIRANVELVAREPNMPVDEQEEELRRVLAEIDDMTLLLNRLLEVARIDRVASSSAERALPVASAVVRDMQPLAADAGLQVTVTGDSAVTVTDGNTLRQVLRIVCDNAIAYTERGGRIDVSVQADDSMGRVTVTDTGIGIAGEDLPHVFERFWRADHSRSRNTGGAGLGLAIARMLVEAAGGSIQVASAPGAGTTVTIRLPLRVPDGRRRA